MATLPPLDVHTHIDPARPAQALEGCGLLLAGTLSLDEADQALGRNVGNVVWGIGCHPRKLRALQSFESDRFDFLTTRSALISEVGLDPASPAPLELQLRVFRQILRSAKHGSHLLSIHSDRCCAKVLEELRRARSVAPVLHRWTGNAAETRQAVRLGCYFSVHPAVARHSKFRTSVPQERLLVETDLGWSDPPAAIPCRIEWTEHLLSVQLAMDRPAVRRLVWSNFSRLAQETGVTGLLPALFLPALREAGDGAASH